MRLKMRQKERGLRSLKDSIINTYRNIGAILAEAKKAKKYTPPKGYRLQTPEEAAKIKKITHSRFPSDGREGARERAKWPHGIKPVDEGVFKKIGKFLQDKLVGKVETNPPARPHMTNPTKKEKPTRKAKPEAWSKGKRDFKRSMGDI